MRRSDRILLADFNAAQIADLFERRNGFLAPSLALPKLSMHDLIRIQAQEGIFLVEILEPDMPLGYALELPLCEPRKVAYLKEVYMPWRLDQGMPIEFVDIDKRVFKSGRAIEKLFLIYPETLPYSF